MIEWWAITGKQLAAEAIKAGKQVEVIANSFSCFWFA